MSISHVVISHGEPKAKAHPTGLLEGGYVLGGRE